jgi:nitroimidazol reductase NimA-like FMN-containing flavoprotein (pyridoxamine 5'-phosphate oxidase superfamily)
MRKKEREITNISDIESIISRADVCHVAFAVDDTPYIVTMNFGYTGGDRQYLFFHCANEGRKLDMMRKNNYVCFEIDTDHEVYTGKKECDWGMKYSSVVGYGRIFITTNEKERKEGMDHIMVHYGGRGNYSYDVKVLRQTTILRLEISEMTGKRK